MAIKKVKDTAAWEGLVKSETESTIGLIEDGNAAVVNGVFVEKPITTPADGDMVFVDGEKKPHLVAYGTYKSAMKPADWEAVGVVKFILGRPLIVWKNNTWKLWAETFRWKVTGWKIDGQPHTTDISFNSSNPTKPTNPTLTYQGSTIEEIIPQLQAWFDAYELESKLYFKAEKLDDTTIRIHLEPYNAWWQSYLKMSGLVVNYDIAQELPAVMNAYKRNCYGNRGAIVNVQRAIEYYEISTGSNEYEGNATTDLHNNAQRSYPINLTTYLGKAADGKDHCADLREIFGEGREGWLECMRDFILITPNTRGVLNNQVSGEGKENTRILANQTYQAKDGSTRVIFPAANYAASVGVEGVPGIDKGDFYLMAPDEGVEFYKQITYGLSGVTRAAADKVNQSLAEIGGTVINCASTAWLSSRCSSDTAWCYDLRGYLGDSYLFSGGYVAPVALYPWL